MELSKIENIARVCHEVNRAYCEAIGDFSQKPWHNTPQEIKNSAIEGVRFKLQNPNASPQQQHEAWKESKIAAGWVYGEVKDMDKKTHPCIVDYAQLSLEHRIKDNLFQGVVNAMQ